MAEKTVNPLGMISDGLGVVNQVGQILGIGQKRQDRRQLEQQKKLTEQQTRATTGLMDYQKAIDLDMWNKTNYGAQIEHLNDAGLNPALIYGHGGGGGATTGGGAPTATGGQAANAAQTQQANTAMGMQMAQLRLMEAQTKKTNAEAENIGTVDREKTAETTAGIKFQNDLNKMIGINEMTKNYSLMTQKLETESSKMLDEYEAWKASGFEGKATDDPSSPMAKAMTAGLQKTLAELEQAKLQNDATEAGNIVKRFEASLAQQGIHPQSPWYVKIITDMLNKAGVADKIQGGLQMFKKITSVY